MARRKTGTQKDEREKRAGGRASTPKTVTQKRWAAEGKPWFRVFAWEVYRTSTGSIFIRKGNGPKRKII